MGDNKRIKQALLLDQDTSKLHKYYNDWSQQYDEDVNAENYAGPRTIASLVVALYRDQDGANSPNARADSSILDAGCGTGLAGAALKDKGFSNIVGVDLSPNMVVQAEKTGAYQALCGDVDLNQPIGPQIARTSNLRADQTSNFDVTVCVGVFTLGHVPPSVLFHLIDVTRSDGLVLVTVREEYFINHNFKEVCQQIESSGRATVEHERWDNYVSYDRALYLALRVS